MLSVLDSLHLFQAMGNICVNFIFLVASINSFIRIYCNNIMVSVHLSVYGYLLGREANKNGKLFLAYGKSWPETCRDVGPIACK